MRVSRQNQAVSDDDALTADLSSANGERDTQEQDARFTENIQSRHAIAPRRDTAPQTQRRF